MQLIPTRKLVRWSAEGPHRTVGKLAGKIYSDKYEGIDESPKGAWIAKLFLQNVMFSIKRTFSSAKSAVETHHHWGRLLDRRLRPGGRLRLQRNLPIKRSNVAIASRPVLVLEPPDHLDFDVHVKDWAEQKSRVRAGHRLGKSRRTVKG